MSPTQYHLYQLLGRCSYPVRRVEYRFVRLVRTSPPERTLTPDEALQLLRQVRRYKSQLERVSMRYLAELTRRVMTGERTL